jgi:hypothetical protein
MRIKRSFALAPLTRPLNSFSMSLIEIPVGGSAAMISSVVMGFRDAAEEEGSGAKTEGGGLANGANRCE